ncbi:MAG: AMP-binding protein [Solirubrobacterales bacterium]
MVSLLEERAASTPGRPFVVMDGGDSRTFGAFNAEVNRLANGLATLGLGASDHVAVLLPNCLEGLVSTFALRKLGAVEISVHARTGGEDLLRILRMSEPKLVLVEGGLVDRINELGDDLPPFDLVVLGAEPSGGTMPLGRPVIPFASLPVDRETNPGVGFHDTRTDAVLFTSGTTGPAKGCLLSHRAGATMGLAIARSLKFREDDCLYCPHPASHIDSRYLTVGAALWTGSRAAIGRRFDPVEFWDELRDLEATVFDFMGPSLSQLWEREAKASDLDNPARLAWGGSIPTFGPLFEERFGLRLASGYGLTDAGVATWRDPELRGEPWGSSGRVVEPYEIRIGDIHDDPVPTGEVGEILIRGRDADVTMKGYLGMLEATLAAFRNGWFHTGDLGRLDGDGRLYFEDRKSESIRRRGENISSWEIEQVLEAYPEVLEAAAIGLPGNDGEDEICAVLVLRDDADFSEEGLQDFLGTRIAESKMPKRFVVVEKIPRTGTGKIEKYRLPELIQMATGGRS